jgi:hypothetical protein
VLEKGYRRLRRAKGNEPLYAKIMACLAVMSLHGALAAPNVWQEWSVTEPKGVSGMRCRFSKSIYDGGESHMRYLFRQLEH